MQEMYYKLPQGILSRSTTKIRAFYPFFHPIAIEYMLLILKSFSFYVLYVLILWCMESISTYIFLIKITKIFAIYSSYWSNIFLDILCIFVLFIFLCFKLLALVVFQKLLVIFPHFNLAWIGSIVSFFFSSFFSSFFLFHSRR